MMFGKDTVWGASTSMMSRPPMMGAAGAGMMPGASPTGITASSMVAEKPPLCKYFVNGGCLRGDQCNYLHELPDERHLDVNGLGFIFNSNVHNAQKTVSGGASGGSSGAVVGGGSSGIGVGGVAGGGGGGGAVGTPTITASPLVAATRKPLKKVIPKYRPPEPFLEHNLPPALALPFSTSATEVLHSLTLSMLDGCGTTSSHGMPRM